MSSHDPAKSKNQTASSASSQTKVSRRHNRGGIDAAARLELQQLIGSGPCRRDALIEYLHAIQDTRGYLPEALLSALAGELKISLAEVAEVASFYHHFDVVKSGDSAPAKLTVRVCDSLTCSMHGALGIAEKLAQQLGPDVRVQRVPCVGRCDKAPVVVVGQNPIEHATPEAVREKVSAGD